jgi:hypothetical protein
MMDMVEDEYNGLLLKPVESTAFAAGIERLIDSAELLRKLGTAAQKTLHRHTWACFVAEEERK